MSLRNSGTVTLRNRDPPMKVRARARARVRHERLSEIFPRWRRAWRHASESRRAAFLKAPCRR